MSNPADVAWMHELREQVQAWIRAGQFTTGETPAYVDLIFAFGLAQVGAETESRTLRESATGSLGDMDAAHRFLLAAYSWRIDEVIAGRLHAGPLPESMCLRLEGMDRLLGYIVDRQRKDSRIVEPDVWVNPYRHWGANRQVANLECQLTPEAFQSEADKLLASQDGTSSEGRSRIGTIILQQCSLARADQVRAAVLAVLSGKAPSSDSDWADASHRVNASFLATKRFRLRDELISLTDKVRRWATQNVEELHRFPPLVRSCIDALSAIDGPHGPDEFLGDISRTILGDLSPGEWAVRVTPSDLHGMRILLAVVERWYRLGRDVLADPVIRASISILEILREQSREADRVQSRLATEIEHALRLTSPPVPEGDIEALLEATPPFLDFSSAESRHHAPLEFLESTWDSLTPVMRSSVLTHATMLERSWEAARVQVGLAIEIVQSLRAAFRPAAAGHLKSLIEALPEFEDIYTTRSHFHATVLKIAESVCLTAVEVCSNGS